MPAAELRRPAAGSRAFSIARVSVGFPPRRCGWSNHAAQLSAAQRQLGHRVVVFQPHGVPESPTRPGDAESPDVRTVPVPRAAVEPGHLPSRLRFAWRAARLVQRLAARERVDLVHVHGDLVELLAFRRLARRLRVPLVATVHGGLSSRRAYGQLAGALWRSVHGVVAVSEETRAQLLSLGVLPERVACISSGVDIGRFAPPTVEERHTARRALGIEPTAALVVSTGRLHPVKGFGGLIDAAARARQRVPSLRVVIIGDGPLAGELAAQASAVPGVRLAGPGDAEAVRRWLHAADAFALPSITLPGQREGTPTAVLEAMACGLPVVVSDSGGGSQVVAAVAGLTVVPERQSAALADALVALLSDPGRAQALGAENRCRAATRDWSEIARNVCAFYEHVCSLPPL